MKRKSWKRTAAFVTSLAMTTTMLPSDLSGFVTSIVHAETVYNSEEVVFLDSLMQGDILYPGATISFSEELNYQIMCRKNPGALYGPLYRGTSNSCTLNDLSDGEAYLYDGEATEDGVLILHFTVISTASEPQQEGINLSVAASTEPVIIRYEEGSESGNQETVEFVISSDEEFTKEQIEEKLVFQVNADVSFAVPAGVVTSEIEYSEVTKKETKYEMTVSVPVKLFADPFALADGDLSVLDMTVGCSLEGVPVPVTANVSVIKKDVEEDEGVIDIQGNDENPIVGISYTFEDELTSYNAKQIAAFPGAKGVTVPKGVEVTVVTAKRAEFSFSDGETNEIELLSNEKTAKGWAATFVMPGYTVTNEKITKDLKLVSTEENAVSISVSGITEITVDDDIVASAEDITKVTADFESHVKITSKVRLTIEYTDESGKAATFGSDVTKDKNGDYIYEFDMPLSDVTISKYHHVHDNSYVISEQKNSIVYKCSNKDNECPDPNETIVEIGLNDDKYVYNGKPQGVKLSGSAVSVSSDNTQGSNGSSSNQLGTVSMTPVTKYYAYDAFGDLISNPLSGVPVNAGSYLAKVTVNEKDAAHDYNGNGKVDSVELEYNYEIERAPITDSNVVWGETNGYATTKYGKAVQVDYAVKDPVHDITDAKLDAIKSAFIDYCRNDGNFNNSNGASEAFNYGKQYLWSSISVPEFFTYHFSAQKLELTPESTNGEIKKAIINSDFYQEKLSIASSLILSKLQSSSESSDLEVIKSSLENDVEYVIEDALDRFVAPSLTRDDDYIILGSDTSSEAGPHTFTVRGKGNYTGSVTKEWNLVEKGKLIKADDVAYKVNYVDGVATLAIKVREPGDANEIGDGPFTFDSNEDGIDAANYTVGGVIQVSKPGTYKAYVKGSEHSDSNEAGYFGNVEVEWTVDEAKLYKSAVNFRYYDPTPVISSGAERVNVKYSISVADLAPGTETSRGLIYCNDGTVTDASALTLEAAASNSSIKVADGRLNANIKDFGDGVVARSYVTFTYTDSKTNAKKTYTVYSTDSVDASYKSLNDEAAVASVKLTSNSPVPFYNGFNRVVCSFNYDTTKNNVKSSGILYCNDGKVTKKSEFTLENAKTNSSLKQAAGVTVGRIKDLGNGVKAVGYVVLSDEVGNETVIYTDLMQGNYVELSESKAKKECVLRAYNPYSILKNNNKRVVSELNFDEIGKDYYDKDYEVVNYGFIYCNDGQVGMAKLTFEEAEENNSVKIADYKSGALKNPAGSIKDNGFGTFVRGFIVVKDSNGYETTIMTSNNVNIGGFYNANNTDNSEERGYVYDPRPKQSSDNSDNGADPAEPAEP